MEVDLKLPEDIRYIRCVVFSAYENPTYIARAAALGAADYLLKNIPSKTLLDTLRHIVSGNAGPEASCVSFRKRCRKQLTYECYRQISR